MRLSGLGAALTADQIYQTALNAGFPPDVATQMTAIALRESSGVPTATNLSPTEQSYGLWQINVQGNPTLMTQLGIADPSQLLDPATNARAAYYLYGGNPNNLNVAWYINRPGYQEAYEQYLPVAQQAALDVSGGGYSYSSDFTFDTSGLGDAAGSDTVTIALAVGGALLLAWWLG